MIRVAEAAWLLELGSSAQVLAAHRTLLAARDPRLRELVPGASTLLVVLDDDAADDADDAGTLLARVEREAHATPAVAEEPVARTHRIPVRYDGEDLAEVARHAGLSVEEAVARHAAAEYRVAFVGFQAGFAYLAGLPRELHVPRRASPRPRVPLGSVAIGGEWTGIYPSPTPGGWNLVGTTDVPLFVPDAEPPALLQPGDRVRFVAR
ncbi:MAG: 5-oxoprolinase subunit PxpB [Thermodesulfobacteriota bacterium]